MKIKSALLLLAAVLLLNFAHSQPVTLSSRNISFHRLPENLGLSQSSINDILQDREGYLWVATWSGLIRYDGYSTKVFHSGNGPGEMRGNLVSCLFEDNEGYLWIGTQVTGLFRYDRKTNRFENFSANPGDPNSISNNNIWKITQDEHNNLWIATEDGLNYFDQKTRSFSVFRNEPAQPNSLSANFITDIFIASDHSLWVATSHGLNHVLRRQNGIDVKRYFHDSAEAAHNFVYQVSELRRGGVAEIWFITKKGIKCLKNGSVTNYLAEDMPGNFSLYRKMHVVDDQKQFIVLGSAMGLSFFDPASGKFEKHISSPDKLSFSPGQSMSVTAIYIDRGGVLWVGTKKGLYKSDSYKKDFDLFLTSSFDITNSIITGIRPADKGYYVSTIGGGLFLFDGSTFSRVNFAVTSKNDFAPFVQALYTDSRGNVWLGTAGAGVIVLNSRKQLLRHLHTGSQPHIEDDYIFSFTEDNQGSVWVGTWNGNLTEITRDWTVHNHDKSLFNSLPVVALHADSTGSIWAGSRGAGVFRIRKNANHLEVRRYPARPGDAAATGNSFINAIYQDRSGVMWLASEGGLIQFDSHSGDFREVPIKDGPTNKVIVGILEDDAGRLWLSHWNGITVVDPRDSASVNVRNFDRHDHIQGGFFYNNVCLKDQGRLFFGGSDGLNVIRPDNIISNPLQPNVILTEFRLFNEPITPGGEVNGRVMLRNGVDVAKEITLEYDENTIAFEFAALDFAAPDKIRYSYILEGLEKQWNSTDASRRYANYTNLPPGEFTFKVRSTNNDGVWNSTVAQIRLVVLPPWWRTTWAYVSYVLLTALLLYAFRKLILIRANFIHDLRFERLERENIEKLNRAKLQFFTNISHEFRTPLTLILGPVQQLIDAEGTNRFFRDQLQLINNNAQRLLRLVNQLLDFRKAESGNLKLRASEGNIVKFLKEVKLSFDGMAEQMRINYSFDADSENIPLFFDRDQFEKILFNLLSNAFKHTPEGGNVRVVLTESDTEVMLTVSNSGKSIRTDHVDKIFHSFFSYDDDRHAAGTGIGLALVKSLVDAHRATIEVTSPDSGGTSFTVRLRKGCAHFDPSEIDTEPFDSESLRLYPEYSAAVGEQIPPLAADVGVPKILIVEDNAEVRTYIRSVLAGHTILEAADGAEGLHLALEEMPELVISDIMMPVMDGINLCRELKSNVRTSHIPVILLTARTSLIFKVEGYETGADDYVNKPFNPRLLQLKVRNLLNTRAMMRKYFTESDLLNLEPKRVTLNSADEQFITRVLESIERNMSSSDYSVEMLGEDVAMSRMQLYRKLKALTGQSGVEFIRTIRLKRAAQLLEQNQLTVAEVTFEVGFNDLQYFRECFKKQFGMTPTEYAQRSSGKETVDQ